jgi:hypothetical protein
MYNSFLNHACDHQSNPLPVGEGIAILSPLDGRGLGVILLNYKVYGSKRQLLNQS